MISETIPSMVMEEITWFLCSEKMPDDETEVLFQRTGEFSVEPGSVIEVGFHDNGMWWSHWSVHPVPDAEVLAWADMPAGIPQPGVDGVAGESGGEVPRAGTEKKSVSDVRKESSGAPPGAAVG